MKILTIPVGFRCYTSKWVRLNRVPQKSYPFNFGFFPVESVERFLLDDNQSKRYMGLINDYKS